MKGFVFLLFLFKALSSTRALKWSGEYNETTSLNDTIVEVFETVRLQNLVKFTNSLVHSDSVDYVFNTPYKYYYIWPNLDKTVVHFKDIWLSHASFNNLCISFGFHNNTLELRSSKFIVELSGKFELGGIHSFSSVACFDGCSISTIRWPDSSNNSFPIDFQYDDVNIKITIGNGEEWLKETLMENCERLLPSILKLHMNRNNKLQLALSEIYDTWLTKGIISKHPHSLSHKHLYHYFISNIPIGSLYLKDIVVKGLSNYHSLNSTIDHNNTVTYRLLVKGIQGRMILEDILNATISILEFHFSIDSLTISIAQEISQINVKAENYTISETTTNTTLNEIRSDILMQQVERAIGSSLMPSMNYQQTGRWNDILSIPELERIIRQHLIKKFAHSETPITLHQPTGISTLFKSSTKMMDQSQCREEPRNIIYNYHISFHDININLLSGNSEYPAGIQCASPHNNSKITHRIHVAPLGKIDSKNNAENTIDLNFNFDYPSVNLSSVKPKNSGGNDSCEFQIQNNRNIQVEVSPTVDNTTASGEQLQMKKRIDATLVSMTKHHIVQTVKPMICLPFDVCSQTAKTIHDFCLKFVDTVLKKCSLKKIKS